MSTQRKTMSLRLHFFPQDVLIRKTIFGVMIMMDDTQVIAHPGAPGFPTRMIHVALPEGYDASRVTARVIRVEPLTQTATFIAPAPQQRISPWDLAVTDASTINRISPVTKLYKQAFKGRRRNVAVLAGSRLEGRINVAEVAIQPVRYDENCALELISEVRLNLTLKPVTAVHPRMVVADQRPSWTERRHMFASHRVVNPEMFESARANTPKPESSSGKPGDPMDRPSPEIEASSSIHFPDLAPEPVPYNESYPPVVGSTPVSVPKRVDYLIITDANIWNAKSKSVVKQVGDLPGAPG